MKILAHISLFSNSRANLRASCVNIKSKNSKIFRFDFFSRVYRIGNARSDSLHSGAPFCVWFKRLFVSAHDFIYFSAVFSLCCASDEHVGILRQNLLRYYNAQLRKPNVRIKLTIALPTATAVIAYSQISSFLFFPRQKKESPHQITAATRPRDDTINHLTFHGSLNQWRLYSKKRDDFIAIPRITRVPYIPREISYIALDTFLPLTSLYIFRATLVMSMTGENDSSSLGGNWSRFLLFVDFKQFIYL